MLADVCKDDCAQVCSLVCVSSPLTVHQSLDFMSRELLWKMHLEIARLEDRIAELCTLVLVDITSAGSPPLLRPTTASTCASPLQSHRRTSMSDVDAVPRDALSRGRVSVPPPSPSAVSAASAPVPVPVPVSLPPPLSLSPRGGGGGSTAGTGTGNTSPNVRPSSRLGVAAALDIAFTLQSVLPVGFAPAALSHASEDGVMAEHEMCMMRSRAAYYQAAVGCPQNLRWKVWLAGARSELGFEREGMARRLLERALLEVRRRG